MIVISQYRASVIIAALEVFITEHEVALHHGAYIDADKSYTDCLLTCIESVEEARIIKQQFIKKFGLKENK